MKSRALIALSALSLLAVPTMVQAAKPGDIELHIEATAQVAPDRAVVPITLSASGQTEAQARTNLREQEDKFMAALAEQGIDVAKVKADGADGGKDPVKIGPGSEEAACAADEAGAVAAAAAYAPAPAAKKGKVTHRVYDVDAACVAADSTKASKTLMVTLNDPTKLDRIQMLSGEDYAYGRLRPVFSQSDPAAARKKARVEALAKANVEAEAYAEALGYRVVRIIRISNAKPSINLPDMFSFIGNMEDRSARMQPSWFAATVSESVRIEYVIAPK